MRSLRNFLLRFWYGDYHLYARLDRIEILLAELVAKESHVTVTVTREPVATLFTRRQERMRNNDRSNTK